MSTRRIVMGAVLLAALLLVSALTTRAAGPSRWAITPVWSVPLDGVQMVAEIPRGARGPAQVIAQGQEKVVVVDDTGAVLATRDFPGGPMSAAVGDVNGDGAVDLMVAQGPAAQVTTFDSALSPLWPAPASTGLAQAARVLAVDLDGDGRREVVVGDVQGRVAALSSAGRLLWSHAFPSVRENADIRGLDDLAGANGVARLVAVARRSGAIALLDARGKVVASLAGRSPVRRLRVFDVDGDGRDEAVVGDEAGVYQAIAANGKQKPLGSIAGTITEIRTLETDGDPARREYVVAGKQGGFVLQSGLTNQARGSVTGKVSAAGGVDCDGDGRDELFLGTEEGSLSMFDRHGEPLAEMGSLGKVERIFGVQSALRERLVVVGAGSALQGFRARRAPAPAWYAPWAPAVIGVLAIMAGALALTLTQPPPAPLALPVDVQATELDLSIARVDDLMARGIVTAEMGGRRLQQLERLRAKRKG